MGGRPYPSIGSDPLNHSILGLFPIDMTAVILASSSPYRASLLKKILEHFQKLSPNIEETAYINESPQTLASRLAQEKAIAVAKQTNEKAIVIGSDQVCHLSTDSGAPAEILCKPGSFAPAVGMLMRCSGQKVTYTTAVCVLDSKNSNGEQFIENYELQFRRFNRQEAERYCRLDEPYDCAGAIKSEEHGVNLIESHIGNDPSALIGLPLIKLRKILISKGVNCR